MALFGKKSGDAGASATPNTSAAPKKSGLGFGRKKDVATAPAVVPASSEGGFEDFSDFSGDLSAPPNGANGNAPRTVAPPRKAAKPRIVGGSSIGLNIGNDSIKVIEMQARGGEIIVTAMGVAHTPAESISNGVVMSVGALENAIRELFKQARIKSKKVTISVAGTGALVVRVIEVPKMTDADLAKNMQVDADRYIPFPPSEVIMDFKALRDLPSDPDSPNMDVLLAAAQREIIDLHVRVLEEAKLDARAIEVEPLAAARALTQSVTKQAQAMEAGTNGHGPNDEIDYNRVSAIINIGASGTEISVLRGDILVFTRTIPSGGNSLTQALVDYLGLPMHDAERVKREWGDALPPPQMTTDAPAYAATAGNDDWSEFDSFGETTSDTATVTTSATATTADPFDPDFFGQGPAQDEPRAPHAQKEGEPGDKTSPSFDFSDFSFADDPAPATPVPATPVPATPVPATPVPATPVPATPVAPTSATPAEDDDPFTFAFPGDAPSSSTAPSSGETASITIEPTTPQSTLAAGDASTPSSAPSAFQFGDEPAAVTPASDAPIAGSGIGNGVGTADAADVRAADVKTDSAWNLGDLGGPAHGDVASAVTNSAPADANDFSFDLPGQTSTDIAPVASADATSVTTITPNAAAVPDVNHPAGGDFDIDSFFGTSPSDTAVSASAAVSASTAENAQTFDAGVPGSSVVSGAGADFDLGALEGQSFGGDASGFGSGLADNLNTGVDAATVYSILHPLLDELANEIRRSLEYHASRYPDAVVQSISVIGGGAKLRNIDVFLTQSLGIPTAIGNPLQRLIIRTPQLPESYAAENGSLFAVAAGLALRDLIG